VNTPPRRRGPNHRLRHWFDRTGFSKTELAALIQERARRHGHPNVAPDASRVRHWLTGEHPRPPVPEILTELFAERLGVPLTVADLGLPGCDTPVMRDILDLAWLPTRTVTGISQYARSDLMLDRRDFETENTTVATGPELLRVVQPWATALPDPLPNLTDAPHGRIGMTEVRQIEEATQVFRTWDNTHGGGLSRDAVVGQLKWAASLLDGPYTDTTGRSLFRAVADLAGVAAWMSFDVNLHAIAQHYFTLALHAAKEAGDRNLGAHILNCMARQMNHLRRPDDALELIQLAQYGARHSATATTRAMLHSLEARSYAVMGRLDDFDRAAGHADDAFRHANADEDPIWVRFFDESEYHATIGICYQIAARTHPDYAGRSATMIDVAISQRDQSRVRSRAFDYIGLARTYLLQTELDGAHHATITALGLIEHLNSTRVHDRLRELQHETRPHLSHVLIRDIHERIDTVLRQSD